VVGRPNPREFRQQLNNLAKRAADDTGATVNEILQRFHLSRLLARVFIHEPDRWVLKGGQALLVRYHDARHSRDVDLLHETEAKEVDQAVRALIIAVESDLDDLLAFHHLDTTPAAGDANATTVRFTLRIGTTAITTISVDLVLLNRALTGPPGSQPLPDHLNLDNLAQPPGLALRPDIRLYPLIDAVADKICAMLETHGNGTPSSRHRDLVDLLLIITREPFDGGQLHYALHAEIARRQQRTGTIRLDVPRSFAAPAQWAQGYRKDALPLPAHLHDLGAAQAAASVFIDPLLTSDPPSRWNPDSHAWATTD
jgi:hypothetical protein